MRYEKINDRKIAIKFINEKLKLSEVTRFFSPNIDTAAKVGIYNKNEILAESILLKLIILAALIVITDLLTPGIKEII